MQHIFSQFCYKGERSMNVEFNADHIQIWKNESIEDGDSDYSLCCTKDGIYVIVGISEELMETLGKWINNIQSLR